VERGCSERVEFVINEGESTARIADRLQEEGLIRSSLVFRVYVRLSSEEIVLQAGRHYVERGMSTPEIAERLTQMGDVDVFEVTFLPGSTLRDMRVVLRGVGFSEAEIEAALTKDYDHPLLVDKPAGASLEGYIFGETYRFTVGATAEEVILRALNMMWEVVERLDLVAGFAAQGLNLHEGITLASVIHREVGRPEDQRKVAQVILNRLAIDMPLGMDAVVAFAADQMNPDRDRSDLSFFSMDVIGCPWNSRHCAGIPPGPIATPGESALVAMANPMPSNYLFFVSGDDGINYFAETYEQHNRNIRDHCRERCLIF